ncbi:MAG: FtsW/RodA/SpoVE family cell cycle protein [Patescibacteria group bacterium]
MSKVDKPFFILVITLMLVGFFIFSSASLALLTKENNTFGLIAGKQLVLGVVLGLVLMFIFSKIHYSFWNRCSLYIFLFSLFLTFLVFLPNLGFSHGGATRWIDLKFITFQPAEILKFGFVIYFATWLASFKDKTDKFKFGLLPLFIILGLTAIPLLLQPDTDTFLIIAIGAVAMYFASGARWRDILIIILIGLIGFAVLLYNKPYLQARISTYLNPTADQQDTGYQLRQSLIAIGSGEIFGRGFGKSLQKYTYLPEPMGDSIFAVFAEEWGIIGSVTLILLFVLLTLRGFKIATNSPNMWSGLVIIGIMTMIITQSFVNIASMLGVIPLSGTPLVFISQGGSSMLFALAEMGLILNISKYQKKVS